MKKYIGLTGAIILSSLALAACGGGGGYGSDSSNSNATSNTPASTSSASSSSGGRSVSISADPSGALAFTKTDLTAKAGSNEIDFDNASSTGHNVEIQDASGKVVAQTDTITGGKTSANADLKPGTYTFFCNIPGHREAGMEGTLKVQ